MSIDFRQIYATRAASYDALVSREDYQGNLGRALRALVDLSGLTVVDVGAGTGRLTRLLAPIVRRITAVDVSPHMLRQARKRLTAAGAANWATAVADARHLPFKQQSVDVVTAGWVLGHFVGWYPHTWQTEIGQAINAMQRVLKSDGALILMETMGTGTETAVPPAPGLAAYYAWLQNDLGFHHTTIATDYRFASVAEAVSLAGFFFGQVLAEKIQQEQLTILPEFTGIWRRQANAVA